MKRIHFFSPGLLAAFTLLASVTARGAAPADLQRILPFTDEFTVVVARLELGGIVPSAWAPAILELLPEQRPAMAGAVEEARQAAQAWLDEFRKAGGEVVYLIVSLSDLGIELPIAVVVPLAAGSDADRLGTMLKQSSPFRGSNFIVLRGCVVAAADPVLQRLKALPSRPPRELEAAFASAPPGVLQAALVPYEDAGRVIEELMPVLPTSFGGGSSTALGRGFLSGAVSIQPPPQWTLELTVRSKTAADAEALGGLITRGLTVLGNVDEVKKHLPRWGELQVILTPKVSGETLRVRLEESQIGELTRAVAMPALLESRRKAFRVMILNNLKQIGLALIMFADDHDGKLPDHLADTLAYVGSVNVLLPPGTAAQPPEDFQRRDRAAQVTWLDQHSGLVYVSPGVRLRDIKDAAKTPLVHQKPELNGEPFVGVCFADGHAEYLAKEAFDRLLERGKNPNP